MGTGCQAFVRTQCGSWWINCRDKTSPICGELDIIAAVAKHTVGRTNLNCDLHQLQEGQLSLGWPTVLLSNLWRTVAVCGSAMEGLHSALILGSLFIVTIPLIRFGHYAMQVLWLRVGTFILGEQVSVGGLRLYCQIGRWLFQTRTLS